ncbi:MAG: YkgJ family cysteine cluster protein [Ignavibacteria bacterium]|nr:YkgJ family cysteine cluster protein [Ignavibacteria bacterium]
MTTENENIEKDREFNRKFHDISDMILKEFNRNLKIYGDKIKCQKGCSKCCSQIFRITPVDAWIIRNHISSLPESMRNDLISKAKNYKPGMPCPALGNENECLIYESRPVICRRFGIPVYDYKNPDKLHACELNFSDGEEINDPLLVPLQTEIGVKWDELKDDFNSFYKTDEKSFCVADAILLTEDKSLNNHEKIL